MPPDFPRLKAIFWKTLTNPTAPGGKISMFHLADPDTEETYMSLGVPEGRGDFAAFIAAACNGAPDVSAALKALVAKIDELTPDINGMFQMATIHGALWPADKNWAKEMADARSALTALKTNNQE